MPMLLDELRTFIPCPGTTFLWADENGGLANIYDDNPEAIRVALLFMQEFYDCDELGVGFRERMRRWCGVHSCEEMMGMSLAANEYLTSNQYNLIYRPLGYGRCISLVVRTPGQAVGLGGLTVHRGVNDRPFTADERRRLSNLEPFVAHLLTSPGASAFPVINSRRTGLIIATPDGQPVHASPEGRHLLFLATHARLSPGAKLSRFPSLPAPLIQLCRNLTAIFDGHPVVGPPAFHHRNVWGGFAFTAHWLQGVNNAAGLIGIVVTYREPLLVGIMRGIESLPLTRRQSQVCRLLANGSSYAEIATELGISKHTAIAHARWIYDKLDVHNRSELINRLVSGLH